ncbi:MAG: hypothetical protein HDT42_05205 [Ruminococcaceae bacterium]|nr:hypothetical protein [Oscillospiraceae bacterium]
MKKFVLVLTAAMCLMLAGCGSNEFAKEEYEQASVIVADDRYAETGFNLTTADNGFNVKAKKFDGRDTLWTITEETGCDAAAQVWFRLSKGKAKLVLIDDNGDVFTVAEASGEEDMLKGTIIYLNKGENKFKLVGYDCKNVEIGLSLNYDIE